MTNEEIIDKAGEKARMNGYVFQETREVKHLYYAIIFNHSFAKAFWGEDSGRIVIGNLNSDRLIAQEVIPDWQFHLQQMVLEEEPIKYLEKFL